MSAGTEREGEDQVSHPVKRVEQFYRPIEYIRTFKTKDADSRERAIRLYCTQSGESWTLQIRSPMSLGSSGYGPESKDFIIAGAPLGLADMRALRDAIDAHLLEAEGDRGVPEKREAEPAPEGPDVYECDACSAQAGTPTLCDRCLAARRLAGENWKGLRPKKTV